MQANKSNITIAQSNSVGKPAGLSQPAEYLQQLQNLPEVSPPNSEVFNGYFEELNALYEVHLKGGPAGVKHVLRRLGTQPSKLAELLDELAKGRSVPLYHADELDLLPPLTWLVPGQIPAGGLTVMYGPSGGGKTFAALDYALTLAQSTAVVYLAAEGESGFADRKNAWCKHNGKGSGQLHFYLEAVHLISPENVDVFIDSILPLKPSLVVVDTLARCMLGGDENSARDMGQFIDACDIIRKRTHAAVMVVHHTGKNGSSERGSSALRGACDSMIELVNEDDIINLSCSKSKDARPFATRYLRMVEVDLGGGRTSCILIPTDRKGGQHGCKLSSSQRSVLETLALETFVKAGAKATVLRNSLEIGESTLYKVLSKLMKRGYVNQAKKGDPFFITELGLKVLSGSEVDDSTELSEDSTKSPEN